MPWVADVVAVIALKDDDRAAVDIQPFQRRQQLSQVAVNRVNGGVIVAIKLFHLLTVKPPHVGDRRVQVLEKGRVFFRHRRVRQVRLAEMYQGGEGLVLIGFDPAHGVVVISTQIGYLAIPPTGMRLSIILASPQPDDVL